MFTLSFYADRSTLYHNRHFTFVCKQEIEMIRLLQLFYLNGNKFRAVYVTNSLLNKPIKLSSEEVTSILEEFNAENELKVS